MASMTGDPLAAIGNARIKFWTCPTEHPREPLRETVRWDGDVATCLDCGRTNKDADELAWANLLATIYDEHGEITKRVGAALTNYRKARC